MSKKEFTFTFISYLLSSENGFLNDKSMNKNMGLRGSFIDSEASIIILFALFVFAIMKLNTPPKKNAGRFYLFDLNSIKIN